MMKMLIGLDEKRIDADGYESSKPLWNRIDGIFEHVKWTKEPQDDGTVLYVGGIDNDNFLADCFVILRALTLDKNFAKYCNKWLSFDNEDDESLPLLEVDVLARERASNPLFKVGL